MLVTFEVIAFLSPSLVHPPHHVHQCSKLGPLELAFDFWHLGWIS